MSKFLGKIINSSRVLPNITNAGGIWNTIEQLQAQKTNTWPITEFKNLALPEITGTTTIGYKALGCTTGTWSIDRNVEYAYQWKRDNIAIPGAISNTYTLIPTDAGTILTCSVTITYTLTNESRTETSLPTTAIVVPVQGQSEYTTAGTYTWVCPEDVYTVSIVCIGGGGAGDYISSGAGTAKGKGGGGGGLGWKNNYIVVPGVSYTVVVGIGSLYPINSGDYTAKDSYFISNSIVKGGAGGLGTAGTYAGDGGGLGGAGGYYALDGGVGGGGGAGGYTGAGGAGGGYPDVNNYQPGFAGSGGGGGGGGAQYSDGSFFSSGNGGGTGIYGQGTSGIGGVTGSTAGGNKNGSPGSSGSGRLYGGALGSTYYDYSAAGYAPDVSTIRGGTGAVRIIWPGNLRQFPNTRTTDEKDVLISNLLIPLINTYQGTAISTKPVEASRGVPSYTYSISPTLPSGLSINSSTGIISGTTVAVANNLQYTVTITDSAAQTTTKIFTLNCNYALDGTYPALVTTTAVPAFSANQGDIVNFTPVTATGGLTPYTFTTDRLLPTGLSINSSTGAITGSTTSIYTQRPYILTVTDSSNRTSIQTFSISILPIYVLVSTTLISNVVTNVGTLIETSPVAAADGLAPYIYIVEPNLPTGLKLDSATGVIKGIPTEPKAATTYTMTIVDATGDSAVQTFTLSALLAPLVITRTTPVDGVIVGQLDSFLSYQPISVSGGGTVYTYSINPTLPNGLTLNSITGVLSGTPTIMQALTTYTITVTDNYNQTADITITITIILPALITTILVPSITAARGIFFQSTPVGITSGVSPYSYSITPALPSGVNINTSTGVISGTPATSLVITSYTVTITDSYNRSSSKQFNLYIASEGVTGQAAYTAPGTYSLIVPAGVYSVSYVAVGGGATGEYRSNGLAVGGGGGGALVYRNTVAVTPGDTITLSVGGPGPTRTTTNGVNGTDSTVTINGISSIAGGGKGDANFTSTVSGTYTSGYAGGYGGGAGGLYPGGGGGAGGYSGIGGNGAWQYATSGTAGSGGGGGGGSQGGYNTGSGTGGGGVGIFGQGSNGAAGTNNGGSGGTNGTDAAGYSLGGVYGGGGGGVRPTAGAAASAVGLEAGRGASGAIRIIWPGSTRVFPSTNTMNM